MARSLSRMKPTALLILSSIFLTVLPVAAKEVPKEIGGIQLGGYIQDCKDLIRSNTMMPLRFNPYIQEVETVRIPGFDYGLIWVADCAEPGRILRIRMKYSDSSQSFYEKVLQRIKARFGDPEEWRGDPFHTVRAWKWSFVDEKGNAISMIFEHNDLKESEAMGNTLKLTLWNIIDKEKACYRAKNPAKKEQQIEGPPEWNLLIPK